MGSLVDGFEKTYFTMKGMKNMKVIEFGGYGTKLGALRAGGVAVSIWKDYLTMKDMKSMKVFEQSSCPSCASWCKLFFPDNWIERESRLLNEICTTDSLSLDGRGLGRG